MANTDLRETTISLPAHIRKGWGRDAEWTATLSGGLVNARGASVGEAKANLAGLALEYVKNHSTVHPRVALDDDGSLVVVFANGSGCAAWRIDVTTGRVTGTTFSEGTPEEYIASTSHLRLAS